MMRKKLALAALSVGYFFAVTGTAWLVMTNAPMQALNGVSMLFLSMLFLSMPLIAGSFLAFFIAFLKGEA
jgi:hypothetical protein